MVIILIIVLHTVNVCSVPIKFFFSSLKVLRSFHIFSWGKVQTAALPRGSESHVPGGIQAEM